MPRSTTYLLSGLLLAVALTVSGCGYSWVAAGGGVTSKGSARGGLPVGSLISVPPVINDTAEPLLSERATTTLRRRLLAAGFRVDRDSRGDGMILLGRVVRFSDRVLAFDVAGVASHRRVVLTLNFKLMDGDQVAWDSPLTIGSASYAVGTDVTRNRDAKDRAVAGAVANLAEQLLLTLSTLRISTDDPAVDGPSMDDRP